MPKHQFRKIPLHFQALSLLQFRSHAQLSLQLQPGLNAFCGPNGSGKTNILEAIHFLCLTKGLHPDRDAVRHGDGFFILDATLAPTDDTLRIHYMPGRGKRIFWNGSPLPRLADHIGRLPVVAIWPEDTDLIRLGGTGRRAWLDALLCQRDPAYLEALSRYDQAVKQRNALLERIQQQGRLDPEELELWTLPLLQHGPYLQATRQEFLAQFLPTFAQVYEQVSGGRELPGIAYQDSLQGQDWPTAFAARQRACLSAGRTTLGTHRDDLLFTLNGTPTRQFGSQGQQKSFLIALKLAQYFYLHHHLGRAPILLLDDLFDKLDDQRVGRLVHLLHTQVPGQVFLTHTSATALRTILDKHGSSGHIVEVGRN